MSITESFDYETFEIIITLHRKTILSYVYFKWDIDSIIQEKSVVEKSYRYKGKNSPDFLR